MKIKIMSFVPIIAAAAAQAAANEDESTPRSKKIFISLLALGNFALVFGFLVAGGNITFSPLIIALTVMGLLVIIIFFKFVSQSTQERAQRPEIQTIDPRTRIDRNSIHSISSSNSQYISRSHYCEQCGNNIGNNTTQYCPNCGNPQNF